MDADQHRKPHGLAVAVRTNGVVEGFEIRVFSSGYSLAADTRLGGPWAGGWNSLSFDIPQLAAGLYYYEVTAVNQGRPSGLPVIGKVYFLR